MKNTALFSIAILFFFSLISSAQQRDTLWFEDFEREWYDDWYVDVGTWEVGTPTSGPQEAYNGNHCAGTVLNGDYTANTSTRLIRINSFVVPKASENPRIRFRYWFRFSNVDNGYLQIKTQQGDWESISIAYNSFGGNLWGYESIDLSAYADSLVQIAFYFHSKDDYYTSGTDVSDGWYIDDVMLVTGPYVYNNPEEFESGLGDWTVEKGTWEVGIPNAGPESVHGGHACAGTYLNGDYPGNIDSKLISPPFIVPGASENPRIHFWHWWKYSAEDWGEVQVRTKNSTWKAVSPRYDRSSGEDWYRTSINLSDYADSLIQIAFYFHSVDDYYTSGPDVRDGWYIDDFSLVTGPYLFNNTEDFETGQGDWNVERGIWEFGTPESGPDNAQGGYNCTGTGLDTSYYYNSDSRLISPPFVVPAETTNPGVRFWHWFKFGSADWGKVQISTDKGVTWETISNETFSTSSSTWSPYYIPISDFAGELAQLAFYFHSVDDYYVSSRDVSDGWYIDNVKIHDNSELTAYAGPDATLGTCESHTLNAMIQGGTEPYIIQWFPETGLDDPTSLTPVASPSDTTTYTLKVTDANGCFRTDRIVINANCEADNTETDILKFGLGKPPQKGEVIINPDTHRVDLEVQYGTELTYLIPIFSLSEGATASVNGIEQQSSITATDFTNPVSYTITAEDGATVQDWIITITVAAVDDPAFLSFDFGSPPQTGASIIDPDLHSVQVKVGNGTDLTRLVANFTLPENASATVGEVAQESGKTRNDFSDPVTYTITAEDGTTVQDWIVTVTEAALYETDILLFSFGSPPQVGDAMINPVNHTVDIVVEDGTNVTGLVASFTLSEGASAKVDEVEQESNTTANDFTTPLTYTITASDGETKQDWTVSVEEDIPYGIGENLIHGMRIYPNPFSDLATIEVDNPDHSELYLSVYGVLGNKVFEKEIHHSESIPLKKGNLPVGVYLVVVRGDNVFLKKKVIIH